MKYLAKITLLIIIFTQYFDSFAIIDFFNKAKMTNTLKNSTLINSWKTLPHYRKILRGTLLVSMLVSTKLPITNNTKNNIFSLGCIILIFRNIYIIYKIRRARNAQKSIKNIVDVLSKNKKGFQKIIKKIRFIKNDYGSDLIDILSSLTFSKTKLALLSSAKLPKLTHTTELLTLIESVMFKNIFLLNHKKNKIIQNLCLKNSKLIDKVNSEILPLITKLNQVEVIHMSMSSLARIVSCIALLKYNIIKCNSNETLNIIAILLLISKFDYLSLVKSNLYFEFLFSIVNFVSLTKNHQPVVEKKEAEIFFSKLDKSMWPENLKNFENINANTINRIANIYFLSKIKKAILNNKQEVDEEDCLDFQNFIHASLYTHLFCKENCSGNPRQICRLVQSYGYLNSVSHIFSWMVEGMEENPIIYTFKDTKETKPIEYKDLKAETEIKKLCIKEEIIDLKKNIESREDKEKTIERFFQEKKIDIVEEKKELLLEEIKYVILDSYQPKNHPDFKSRSLSAEYDLKNKASTQEFISKKLPPNLLKLSLKLAAWGLILNLDFPH